MKKIIVLLAIVFTAFSCSGDDDSTCTGAISAAASALTDFNANQTNDNCLALKSALENQRDVCGSLSESLTNTLAGLECQN
ncbi:hypothetical protein [Pseudofulvibacter geojedonensis]|uniref:Lipoprotein n=1 Tax=Pseudofulvibacter geojedonensis TaxID=1123758 RepID=A0ABW3I0I1_9FLAO